MNFRQKTIEDILKIIQENLANDLSIDNISDISGCSKWRLQRMFKKYMGIKIGEYIRKVRLHKAAVLLKNSDASILDIAMVSGFSSQPAFTRSFKRYFNDTPYSFRVNAKYEK